MTGDSPPANSFAREGETLAFLDLYEGLQAPLDAASMTLNIIAPARHFRITLLALPRQRLLPTGGQGAYLNYDAVLNLRQGQAANLSATMEAVIFAPEKFGIFETTAVLRNLTESADVTRLETRITRDFLHSRRVLVIGDTVTAGRYFGGGLRFGGIRWGTDFSLDPTFVRAPHQTLMGLAERPSLVEVYVNDLKRSVMNVPVGPFEISNITGLSGDGTVQLVVTDILGQQQIINLAFYFAPQNLQKGLKEYSLEAGFLRRHYTRSSFDYGKAFAAGSWRLGVSDALTAGVNAEIHEDVQGFGVAGSLAQVRIGVFSVELGVSRSQHGVGYRYRASYDYQSTAMQPLQRTSHSLRTAPCIGTTG